MKRYIKAWKTTWKIAALGAAMLLVSTGCSAGSKQAPVPAAEESSMEKSVSSEESTSVEESEESPKSDTVTTPDSSESPIVIPAQNGGSYVIETAGSYLLTGQAENFTVKVDAGSEDEVQIELDSTEITNEDFPVLYVKSAGQCLVTVSGDNKLSVSGEFTADGDINTDAAIFSKDDLVLDGTGTLTIISAAGNGITSKDTLTVHSGTYTISSAKDGIEANDAIIIEDGSFTIETEKDGFHCENDKAEGSIDIRNGSFVIQAEDDGIQATTTLTIDGGTFEITAAEGLEATYVTINDGVYTINASDDGINAAEKSSSCEVVIEINGGEITIVMGPGDTDGLDANGTIIVNGGTIDVTCNSPFDADNGSVYNGGTIIINGEQVDSIPESMMGGRGRFGDQGGFKEPGYFGENGDDMGDRPQDRGPGGPGRHW